jgi:hypothetical protein
MIRTFSTVTAVLAVGLTLSGCAKTTESATGSSTASATAASSPAEKVPADLQSLLPAPAGATTKGPDSIADNGIHMHYEVKGAPGEVMDAYKQALENKGWEVNTVVTSGNGGGGGATYSGTNGAAYGVFDGGGPSEMTYIDVCTWAEKPTNPNCSRGGR